jgi:DNA-binding CsgD family transcriptional regulator
MLRAEGLPDAVVDAVLACKRAPRRESLGALAASLGFDGFSYIVLGSPSTQPRILEHWTSATGTWTARYAARAYHLVAPRVTMTRNRSVPVAWSRRMGTDDRHASEFLEDAERHHLRGGVAWSVFDTRVGRAVVAWDSKHEAHGAPLGARLATIALLAGIAHEALVAHCSATAPARTGATLPGRERDCMALVARGMTSADVGLKLGITTRTANFHVGNVMAKLGAVSRGEAIARAIAANLVSID